MQTSIRPPKPAGFFLASFFLLAALCGCQSSPTTYTLTGRVISKHPDQQQLIIDNDNIPGFMAAMTMPYDVKDPAGFQKVQPADVIRAVVVVGPNNQFWLEHLEVTGKAAARPASDASPRRVLMVGDKVPDVPMVNQDGKTMLFSQLKGKLLLLTFIYTRCPFPDYCPLISRQFSTIQNELGNNPVEFQNTHLISVSLDPDFDKPAVLREYGLKYMDHNPAGFKHWDFVSTSAADLQVLTKEFGLDYSAQDNGQLSHTLNTILIARDGTVAEVWPGNEWRPPEILDVTRHALSIKN
jgi:protein SCO1/2